MWTDLVQAVSAAVLAAGIGFAAVQYKRARRHERMRWLGEFYAKFYEQPNFLEVRNKLVFTQEEGAPSVADLFQDPNVTNFMNVAVADAHGVVHGEVYELERPTEGLVLLDEVEGYHPKDPKRSLFRREVVEVLLGDGTKLRAWVYFYNRPHRQGALVPSGRYREELRA
ncbi:MAG: gamma-glutamylcyclotransferase [SAR202 cluster bacterium]|nr:gamma-glutamylcyclotransferase [SAR202 cluster bacterium]